MIEKLFVKEKEPYLNGKVLSLNPFTKKASVKTTSGLTILAQYDIVLSVGDKVIVAGTHTKFIIQKFRDFIPTKNEIVRI